MMISSSADLILGWLESSFKNLGCSRLGVFEELVSKASYIHS